MNKGGPFGRGGQPFNRAIQSSTEQKSFGRAPSADAAMNIVSGGGRLTVGTTVTPARAAQRVAIGPPWLIAHVLLDAKSYDLNEQFQLSVRSLDRASDTGIHFQDIGNPRIRGEVYERIASPELLEAQELEADIYQQEIQRLGGDWHHRLTETEKLASQLGIALEDLPVIAFRTNPFTHAVVFALKPSWYATREARWGFIETLKDWLVRQAPWLKTAQPMTIESLMKNLGNSLQSLTDNIEIAASAEVAPTPDPLLGGVFLRQNDVWRLRFEGPEAFVPHRKGMEYIAVLLRSPNKQIAAETLWHTVNGTPIAKAPFDDLVEGRSSDKFRAIRVPVERQRDINASIDEPAELAYRDRVAKLDRKIADAKEEFDHAKIAELQDERDSLMEELDRLHKPNKSRSTATPESKRVRNAIRKAIDESVDLIKTYDALLAEHLNRHIQTGAQLQYSPFHFISWDV